MVVYFCQYHNRELDKSELMSKKCKNKNGRKKCKHLQVRNQKPKYENRTNFLRR